MNSLWQVKTHFVKKMEPQVSAQTELKIIGVSEGVIPPDQQNPTEGQVESVEPLRRQRDPTSRAGNPIEPYIPTRITRSGRVSRMPSRYINYSAITGYDGTNELEFQEQDPMLMYKAECFKAVANPDILYYDQALNAPDRHEFIKAMLKEV